jgi:hypothetical protein
MNFAKDTALVLAALLISILVGEVAVRWLENKHIFALENYRANGIVRVSSAAEYDAHLGWRLKANFTSPSINTLDYGIRRNGSETTVRTGGVLAVGDSFTVGSEVLDHESWPAQLEQMIGVPVINAASGGYGTDQIVLRIEQMLPIVQPKIVLVGMFEADIARSSYSIFNLPKPYYTVEKGELVLHNSPVPREPPELAPGRLKVIAGYSAIVNRVMSTIDPHSWYAHEAKYVRVSNDPVDVTCRLLHRLKRRTDELGIRTLLVMQYGGPILRSHRSRPGPAQLVLDCATAMGIQPVDEFDSLSTLFRQEPEAYRKYYVLRKGPSGQPLIGHMSAYGNRHIASLIVKALEQSKWEGKADDYVLPSVTENADGVNLLSETIESGKLIRSAALVEWSVQGSNPSTAIHRVQAVGEKPSEHYVVFNPLHLAAGVYSLSMEIKAEADTGARVQFLDGKNNGLIADVNLGESSMAFERMGRSLGILGKVEQARQGWSRVSLSAWFPGGDSKIIVQLANAAGSTNFLARSEALQFRSVRLERGQFR